MVPLGKGLHEEVRLNYSGDGERTEFLGLNLLNKTIGIVGLGNTGGRVAEICIKAFNCKVLSYDPYLNDERFKMLAERLICQLYPDRAPMDMMQRYNDFLDERLNLVPSILINSFWSEFKFIDV